MLQYIVVLLTQWLKFKIYPTEQARHAWQAIFVVDKTRYSV